MVLYSHAPQLRPLRTLSSELIESLRLTSYDALAHLWSSTTHCSGGPHNGEFSARKSLQRFRCRGQVTVCSLDERTSIHKQSYCHLPRACSRGRPCGPPRSRRCGCGCLLGVRRVG